MLTSIFMVPLADAFEVSIPINNLVVINCLFKKLFKAQEIECQKYFLNGSMKYKLKNQLKLIVKSETLLYFN